MYEIAKIIYKIIVDDFVMINDDNILINLYFLLKKEGLLALLRKVKTEIPFYKKIKNEVLFTAKKNAIDNDLRKYKELIDFLEKEKIQYVVLKGNYLIRSVYGDIKYRHSNDMDILIEEKQTGKIVKILTELGYVRGEYDDENKRVRALTRKEIIMYEMETDQMAPYVKINANYSAHPCTLDIHLCFELSNQIITNQFLGEYEYKEFNGVQIRCLNNELFFLQVCLHHYKHMKSVNIMRRGSAGLRYICDVYFFYFKNYEMINLNNLVTYIKENNFEEYVYYFMYHGQRLWGENEQVKELMEKINKEGIEEYVYYFGLGEKKYFWYDKFDEWLFSTNGSINVLEEVILKNMKYNE